MKKKNPQLNKAAVQIGTALGKVRRAARAVEASGPKTKKEMARLKKSLGALARELESAAKRVKKALR
jgi:hypothetical protein